MTIKVIKDVSDASLDIVLVPGLTIAGKPNWTSANSVFWPETLLPQKVPKARILAFDYDEDLTINTFWNKREKISSKANDLIGQLVEARSGDKAKRPVIFVAHCLGGLVLQSGLVRANRDASDRKLVEKVSTIVLLGTPHYNSQNLHQAKPYFQVAGTEFPAGSNLESLSTHVMKVPQEFAELREANSIKVEAFYGDSPVYINDEEVYIVDAAEAKQPGEAPDAKSLEGNHHEIARFDGDNKDFKTVFRAITKAIDDIPKPEAKGGGTNISFKGNNSGFQIGQNNGELRGFSFGSSK